MIFNSDKTRAKDAAKNLEKAEFKKGLYEQNFTSDQIKEIISEIYLNPRNESMTWYQETTYLGNMQMVLKDIVKFELEVRDFSTEKPSSFKQYFTVADIDFETDVL